MGGRCTGQFPWSYGKPHSVPPLLSKSGSFRPRTDLSLTGSYNKFGPDPYKLFNCRSFRVLQGTFRCLNA